MKDDLSRLNNNCDACGLEIINLDTSWRLEQLDYTDCYDLCSIDCVTDIAWELRGSRPKLSKSVVDKPGDL